MPTVILRGIYTKRRKKNCGLDHRFGRADAVFRRPDVGQCRVPICGGTPELRLS